MTEQMTADRKEVARFQRRQKRLAALRADVVAGIEKYAADSEVVRRYQLALAVIDSGRIPCRRCHGTGSYEWGAVCNGVPSHRGVCYGCNGSGANGPAIPDPREVSR